MLPPVGKDLTKHKGEGDKERESIATVFIAENGEKKIATEEIEAEKEAIGVFFV